MFKKGGTPWNKGKKMSDKYKSQRIGKNNGRWKGGRRICKRYILIYCPTHPYCHNGAILEHRLVMEKYIGRVLLPTEIVHHINGNYKDNKVENLMLFSNQSEHVKHHKKINNRYMNRWDK